MNCKLNLKSHCLSVVEVEFRLASTNFLAHFALQSKKIALNDHAFLWIFLFLSSYERSFFLSRSTQFPQQLLYASNMIQYSSYLLLVTKSQP
jgi:hypothetical protein